AEGRLRLRVELDHARRLRRPGRVGAAATDADALRQQEDELVREQLDMRELAARIATRAGEPGRRRRARRKLVPRAEADRGRDRRCQQDTGEPASHGLQCAAWPFRGTLSYCRTSDGGVRPDRAAK